MFDKFGEEKTSFEDQKRFLMFLNFGAFIFPLLVGISVALVTLLFLAMCARNHLEKAFAFGVIVKEVCKYLMLIVTLFLNINFLVKRNGATLLVRDIDQYDFLVNSFLVTCSLCQLLILFE